MEHEPRCAGWTTNAERGPPPCPALDNVVKTYGPIRAVDGVSLTALAGEFIALLGPNGAGKSTLFQLLSGLFVADSGRIEVMGHDMSRDPCRRWPSSASCSSSRRSISN